MAVPQEILSAAADVQIAPYAGPFESGNKVYFISFNTSDSALHAWVADTPTSEAFALVDDTNNPTANTYSGTLMTCFQSGTDIICVHQISGNGVDMFLSVFHMATDLWSAPGDGDFEDQIGSKLGTNAQDTGKMSAERGAGDPLVTLYVEDVKFMGTDRTQPMIATRDAMIGSGTWTASVQVSSSALDDIDNFAGRLLLGTGNTMHAFWVSGSTSGNVDLFHRSFSSANAMNTEQEVISDCFSGGSQTGNKIGTPARYDVSGTIHLRCPYNAEDLTAGSGFVEAIEADAADDPTWTTRVIVSDTAPNRDSALINDPTTPSTLHNYFGEPVTTDDILTNEQADGGSWSADAEAIDVTGDTGSTINVIRPHGDGVYDYGGGTVLGVIYSTADGNYWYDEISFGAVDTPIAVPAGSLTLAGQTPSLDFGLTPGAGALVLAGVVPNATVTLNKEMPVGTLAFTGQAPAASVGFNLDVPVGGLVLSGQTPAALVSVNIPVPAGSLTFAGQAPDDIIAVEREVPVGALTFTGQAPALQFDIRRDPGVGALVLGGLAPALQFDFVIDVPAGALVLAGQTPALSTGVARAVPAGSLVFASDATALAFGLEVPAGALVLQGQTPGVGIDQTAQPGVGTLTFAGQAPSVIVPVIMEMGVGALLFTPPSPTMDFGIAMPLDPTPC